jgi:hypothetical protein
VNNEDTVAAKGEVSIMTDTRRHASTSSRGLLPVSSCTGTDTGSDIRAVLSCSSSSFLCDRVSSALPVLNQSHVGCPKRHCRSFAHSKKCYLLSVRLEWPANFSTYDCDY